MNNRKLQDLEKLILSEIREALIEKKYKMLTEDILNIVLLRFFSFYIGNLITHPIAIKHWQSLTNSTELTPKYHDYQKSLEKFNAEVVGSECNGPCRDLLRRNDLKDADQYLNFLSSQLRANRDLKNTIGYHEYTFLFKPSHMPWLINMAGRSAWFAKDSFNFIMLDDDWNKHVNQTTPEDLWHSLTGTKTSLETTINLLLKLRLEGELYETDENIRSLLNLRHDVDSRYVKDPMEKYRLFARFCAPLELVSTFLLSTVATTLTTYSLKHALRPFRPLIMKKLNMFEMTRLPKEKKLNLMSKGKEISLLTHQVDTLKRDIQRINDIKNVIHLLSISYMLFDLYQECFINHNNQNDDELFKSLLSLIRKILFTFFSMASLMYVLKQQYSDSRLELQLTNMREQFAKEMRNTGVSDVAVYKSSDLASSLFILLIQKYGPLPSRKVTKIIINKLKNYGCKIEASYSTKHDEIQKIGVRINKPIDFQKLSKEIKVSLDDLTSITTLHEQMRELAKIVGASLLMVPVRNQNNNHIFGETTLAFSNVEKAQYWFEQLRNILPKVDVIRNDHRLNFNIDPFEANQFEEICTDCSEAKSIYQASLLRASSVNATIIEEDNHPTTDDKGKERDVVSATERRIKIKTRKTNHPSTVSGESKQEPSNQRDNPSRKASNSQIVSEQSKIEITNQTDKPLPYIYPTPYVEIANSPFWTKPHYIQFNLTVNDFGGDQDLYEQCMKKVFKGGLAHGQQGSEGLIILGENDREVKDCTEPHRKFMPFAKFKMLGKKGKGNIRLFAEKRIAYVAEANADCEVYDIKGIDLRAHQRS